MGQNRVKLFLALEVLATLCLNFTDVLFHFVAVLGDELLEWLAQAQFVRRVEQHRQRVHVESNHED